MRASKPLVGVVVLLGLLTACNDKDKASEARSVTAVKADSDKSYLLGPTVKVSNEDFSDGRAGLVVVSIKRGKDHGNRVPLLEATVEPSGVHCGMFRMWMYSDFKSFDDYDLPCDDEIPDLSAITEVRVHS